MIWLVLFFVCAVINWLSVEFGWRRVEFLSKPGALFFLILFFWQMVGWENARLWFGFGLVLSLVGDIFLLWSKRFFLPGLATFLLAHVCYVIGLNQDPIALQLGSLLVLVLTAAVGFSCHRTIRKGMARRPENAGLRWPVLAYCLVISLMLMSAWLCLFRPLWLTPGNCFVAVGATLFMFSDFLLAYGMFVRSVAHSKLLVMITYHLGQAAIAVGVMLRFLG